MGNDVMQTIVSEKRQAISFRQLLDCCKRVRIPRIQRAYAQGRKEEQLIRENLLTDLFTALRSGSVLELNYVYGALNDGCLDVLDGQQRLTTLFLLHWYCANAEEDDIPSSLKRFTYETRPESGYFLEDFTRDKIDFKGRRPSDAIKGMLWFSHAYKCDPTVTSMLRMLDAIHEHYLAEKRASCASNFTISPSLDNIRFYLHSLDGYARTEELYIKMNARGLLLTPFENFKADLVDWLQRQKGDFAKPVVFGGREMDWWQRFVAKIDTDWTDFFWAHSEDSDSKTDDTMLSARLFRLFVRHLLYRRLTCCASETAETLQNDATVRFLDDPDGDGAESQTDVYLGFEHYKTVLEKVPHALMDMEHVLDLLKQSFGSFADVDDLLRNPHGDIDWSWVGDKGRIQRTQSIAISAALAFLEAEESFVEVEFKRWMRVVWNTIQNTNIDGILPQIRLTRLLVATAHLPGCTRDVYETLANLPDDNQPRAVAEEIRKARMITTLPEGRNAWEKEIITAEQAPFFQGMIGFYIQDDMTLNQFMHRREMARKLFDKSGIAELYREGHRLLRAMLAQIPMWKNGMENLFLSENVGTKDAYLKNFLAGSESVRNFFRNLTDLPDETAMNAAISRTLSSIPIFDATTAEEWQKKEMALFYQRLVGDPRVLDWAAAVESEKRKSPVVEWRYGHCMLNFRKSWAARLVLGVDREEMAQKLMEEFDFSITSQEQRKALDNFGYFTDFSVELLKSVEGGHIKVVFRMDHAVEIQGPDGTSETISYGSVETFPPILENIRRKLQNDLERKTTMSITIKPVRFTENGFMTQPFALGGEGAEGLDPAVRYRSCLQNWVIDTGSEVILVDTGLPAEFPDAAPTPDASIHVGYKIKTYLEALADLGYRPEQVSKILITHKHADHTGMLGAFSKAEIICSAAEAEADEIKPFHPTVATFQDGPYHEFPASQKIAEGVTYLPAPGHTKGNCIVAVETDGLFYLIHGDVTYTDVALYENKLSVVYEDLAAARETLDRVRAFCAARPTVYLGTHTPEALESLAAHRVVDLARPPAVIPPGEIVFKTATGKYVCSVCGYVYDPAEHDGVAFEDLPADWRCPRCKQPKDKFNAA